MTGVVIAHGGGLEMVNVNRPTWDSWFDHIEWVCPEDDPLPWGCHKVGESCKQGQGCVDRQRAACVVASQYDTAAILEYDTILFREGPVPVKGEMYCSWVFYETRSDHPYYSSHFGHSPWVCHKEDYEALSKMDVGLELGYSDRWMAAAAKDLNIQMHGIPHCWSELHIREMDMRMSRAAIRNGATAIHGIKTRIVSNQLVKLHETTFAGRAL